MAQVTKTVCDRCDIENVASSSGVGFDPTWKYVTFGSETGTMRVWDLCPPCAEVILGELGGGGNHPAR